MFLFTTILPIFILLTCSPPVISMHFKLKYKTVWILIRWLLQKPADLDLQCFQKRIDLVSARQGVKASPLEPMVTFQKRKTISRNTTSKGFKTLQKPADLDLLCFQKRINLVSAGQGVKTSPLEWNQWSHFKNEKQ